MSCNAMAASTTQLDIDTLKAITGITDAQLDSRIREDELWELSGLLGSSFELYMGNPGFKLNAADQADLRACSRDYGHQHAMTMAFTKWFDVARADKTTYRSLVKILIKLRQKSMAEKVCITGELIIIIP